MLPYLKHCQKALNLLREAEQHSPNGKWIEAALRHYAEAFQLSQGRAVEPLMGMAYIAFLNQKLEACWGLIEQAEELAPGHLKLAQLKLRLQRLEKRGNTTTAPHEPQAVRRLDLGQESPPEPEADCFEILEI